MALSLASVALTWDRDASSPGGLGGDILSAASNVAWVTKPRTHCSLCNWFEGPVTCASQHVYTLLIGVSRIFRTLTASSLIPYARSDSVIVS